MMHRVRGNRDVPRHPLRKPGLGFSRAEVHELHRLADAGYGPASIARQLHLPADAVSIWMRRRAELHAEAEKKPASFVTLPRVRFLEAAE